MNKQFSLYLDLIRFFAAILVVISHSNARYISTEKIPFAEHGHIAVMIFFVLSGFVISFITDVKENRFSLYWSSRISRIYSVALPAILLVPLIDIFGSNISQNPAIYDNVAFDPAIIRFIASLFFLNETWFLSIMSFSNTPFWSLCYEVSYYLIFSFIIFLKPSIRWWAVGIFCLLIGPKILLLFPVWLYGVYLYRSTLLNKINQRLGWILFLTSTGLIILWEYLGITSQISDWLKEIIGKDAHTYLAFSRYFIGDWFIGLLVLANFAGFRAIAPAFAKIFNPFESPIRFFASYTLTIYLFHQPLLLLFSALINGDPETSSFYWITLAATLFTSFIIGSLTEIKREKFRYWLRQKLMNFEEKSTLMAKILIRENSCKG